MFTYEKGIQIAGLPLWLDSTRKVDTCVVSHAHMDHAKKHRQIICTEPTAKFLARRLGKSPTTILAYNAPYEFEDCRITLYPAGHILGSAQTLVEKDGCRLLYSGDFNTIPGRTVEPIEIPQADILIMESTFGRPYYRFPARRIVEQNLIDFVRRNLQQGNVPVVSGYTLGKSQEAMKILGDAGFKLSVHGSVAVLARVYEKFGIDFGDWQKFKRDEIEGKVLVIPRNAIQSRMVERLEKKQIVFLSGWAVSRKMKYRYGVDEALPLSDHCDYGGLLDYVRKVNPGKIYTTHGFADFPKYLRDLGFDASPLEEVKQVERRVESRE